MNFDHDLETLTALAVHREMYGPGTHWDDAALAR